MITAERLKELIKQGATIYRIVDGVIIEMGLADEIAEIYGDMLYYQDGIWWYIKDLFETKKQAEWHRKMDTKRIERFEPPMWEDIDKHYTFDWFNQGCHYRLAVDQPRQYIIVINFSSIEDIFDEPATKENYIKACEIVRDLFNKGGAK